MNQLNKQGILDGLKAYMFPTLVTIIGMLIWRDIAEMRSDVKMLLAQSNIDKTKIESLEKDVRLLQQVVFHKRTASATVDLPLFMKLYFKPEEEFDVKRHLKSV